ncbi:hypothetical protein [Pseudoalteromonas sp. S2755]|uniref:hypothetical protein n=1 Tax=Pseudoalteromonas sp. S2755 TaxID=2066523 RepID=UPI0014860CA1|nr:hypothetical protein [Pseudoalteromonas sp. S2755]
MRVNAVYLLGASVETGFNVHVFPELHCKPSAGKPPPTMRLSADVVGASLPRELF